MMWIECLSSASYSGLNGKLEIGRGRGKKGITDYEKVHQQHIENRCWNIRCQSAGEMKTHSQNAISKTYIEIWLLWVSKRSSLLCHLRNTQRDILSVPNTCFECHSIYHIPFECFPFSPFSSLSSIDAWIWIEIIAANRTFLSNIPFGISFWFCSVVFFPSSFLFWYI